MSEFASLSVEARLAKFVEIYRWLLKASEQRILPRSDLQLKAVHPFANALTIVDISSPDFWRIRLAGTQTCERVGHDATGDNAQLKFSQSERDLRSAVAHTLFQGPYGVRAITRETYTNGEASLLDTVAVPLLGQGGERIVAHYAQVLEDIDHDYRDRPAAQDSTLVSHRFIDLGFGLPMPERPSLSA